MIKKHFKSILGSDTLDYETFLTVMVEVEGIINRRPLCPSSVDVWDVSVLCPADFLYPGVVMHTSINLLPPAPPTSDHLRFCWANARRRIDEFWKIWVTDYLQNLHGRKKWQGSSPNVYEGQVVFLEDSGLARDKWPLYRVKKVMSEGEMVRSVIVENMKGDTYHRHITSLIPLELEGI